MKTRLGILFGGMSSEHEVSLVSAYGVITNVDRDKFDVTPIGITKDGKWYLFTGDVEKIKDGSWCDGEDVKELAVDPAPRGANFLVIEEGAVRERLTLDVVFPVLHGANGEDGTVQGLLEMAGVPFVGPDHTSSGVCMDKAFTKRIVKESGAAAQARAVILTKNDERESARREIEKLGYPVFVKPARAGSSVGVTKVKTPEALDEALERAFREDGKILVEEFIKGREIEVAVMETAGEVVASVPGEIDPGFEFYDYDTKYQNDTASYYIPARLDKAVEDEVRERAVRIFKALDCRTLSRVDFFVKADGSVVFNEINTIPGFTPISMYPKLFMQSGMSYSDVITALAESAMKKER